jgi:hypothetical protein
VIALLIHVLCSCVAFVCRVLGRYRHVGEKRPDLANVCPGACEPGSTCVPNPEGRYVDRYGLIGAGLTDGGLDGFVSRWLGVNVWLQRIWRADGDRHMHDHPWNVAGSLILSGGYSEARAQHTSEHGFLRVCLAFAINLLPAGVYHRIVDVRPRTWTLFVTGRPHSRGWGFLVDGQHVPSAVYLGDSFFRGQAEKAERLAPHVRNFGCAIPEAILEIDIVDEIPDTLRNDGQPDTEREPSTRRRDACKDGSCIPVEHPANALAAEALEREGFTVKRGRS